MDAQKTLPEPQPTVWTDEWPTDPGRYWFYGWRSSFSFDDGRKPELFACKAMQSANGRMTIICEGAFLYREEGAEGYFLPCLTPEPPSIPSIGFAQP
jgi:hypothetical protein